MNKYNLTYESKNLKIPLTVTVLAYSIKTAAAEFHNFAGFLRIIKIEESK